MLQVRFRDPAGTERTGELTDGGVRFGDRTYDPDEIAFLPPSEPTKIVCAGLNYTDHAEETDSDIPDRPVLFLKTPNTVAAPESTVSLPRDRRIDYEGELGVVISQQCRNVSSEEAMEYVRGYICLNDMSNRDDQRIEQNWVRGKSFDNSAPMGPALATPEKVPSGADIELRVNGETKQQSTLDNLIFPVPDLIAEITDLITLEPGDIVATGTPAGVGPLEDGDHVEVEIEGIGTLAHDVIAGESSGEVEHDFMPDL